MITLKRIVASVLFFCFCFLTGTGLMMKFSFVKGLGPQTVLGFSKHDWEVLHMYVGLAMLVAVILHLFSSKTWIEKVGAKNKKWLALLVLALGVIMLLVLALSPAALAAA